MADLWRDFWIRETGTGQQVAQLHDICNDDDLLEGFTCFSWESSSCLANHIPYIQRNAKVHHHVYKSRWPLSWARLVQSAFCHPGSFAIRQTKTAQCTYDSMWDKIVILKLAVAKPLAKFPAIYAIIGTLSVYCGQPFYPRSTVRTPITFFFRSFLISFFCLRISSTNLIFMDPCIVIWISRNNQQDATL